MGFEKVTEKEVDKDNDNVAEYRMRIVGDRLRIVGDQVYAGTSG